MDLMAKETTVTTTKETELDEDEIVKGWETEVEEWRQSNQGSDDVLIFTLYKKGRDKAKEQVYEWEEEIPRSHYIGCRFGGGNYTARVRLPDLKGKKRVLWRSFVLSTEYDLEREEYLRELKSQQTLNGVPAHPARSDLDTIKFLMSDLIKPMMEMFRAQQPQPESMGSAWKAASETVNGVLADSLRNQINQMKEFRKEIMAPEKIEPMEVEGTVNDWKDLVKDLIKEHGPTLLEAGMLKLKAMSAKLRNEEIFVQMKQSPIMLGKVLDALKQDPEMQKPEVNLESVLSKLSQMGIGFQVATRTEKINPENTENV